MNIPDAAVALVKQCEGLRLKAYKCPAGILTIGYGHTTSAGPPAVLRGTTITATEATAILWRDLENVAARLRPMIDVALTDNQFGALVSFAFNLGVGAFESSTLRKLINDGRLEAVPAELRKWTKATVTGRKVVLAGLVKRREAEGALWSRA